MKKSATRSRFRTFLSWSFKLAIVGMVILGILLAYLDAQVRSKFEGKRWALPAKVYARPMELYPGLDLKAKFLIQELEQVGYRRVPNIVAPGHYTMTGSGADVDVDIYRRFFPLFDGNEDAARVRLSIRGHQIKALWVDGAPADIARLEPLMIGGIYPKHNEDRELIQLEEVPQLLIDTLVAVEDRDFYDHFGISLKGIARAMVVNIQRGGLVQGGSTLTQQLVKNFFLTRERSLKRKATEALMALLVELHYSKDEILEAYLNEVYLGQSGRRAIHGFGLASLHYFGKHISNLNAPEMAMLVGMVKGPSVYHPRYKTENAKARRNVVLTVMNEQGLISDYQALQWTNRDLNIVEYKQYQQVEYPAYLDLVRRQLRQDYAEEDLTSEGLRIYTSLNPITQRQAEQALQKRLNRIEQDFRLETELQGAMVVASTQSGEIEALIGDRNPRYFGFNRALDAKRSIGSLAKPAVYLTALRSGPFNLISPIDDSEIAIAGAQGQIWEPQNYDKESHGVVPLYQAMAKSYNQATARLGMNVGLAKVKQTFADLGVEEGVPPYPSMLLGAFELAPIDVAQMYQTIAASGFKTPLKAIRGVTTADGQLLSRYGYEVKQSIDSDSIYLIQRAMQQVVKMGTARYLNQIYDEQLGLAGKTGTSDSQRDSWFAGFSGDTLGIVWVGSDDNRALPITGSSAALRVWANTFREIPLKPLMPIPTKNIVEKWVNIEENAVSEEGCDDVVQFPFIHNKMPPNISDCSNQKEQGTGWWSRFFGNE
ncbi:penicillin-binding protein 1B [Bermanella marisrubri]|uniref:Penicillin-binding protein 1B n=1 Tax=Bermanella marisrubri TaxID=207949 RepID=Q1MY67_9GAMM|nr:penicillin-binding protein 1B [Bermanella marisrubri]EAT10893.1 penicillin-binding protein 1B [Oceanobacter sp. RED65] [Bermanella marisrubri]QIZ85339.1 penicillin-binding protein 1B [Bermanella marisrubri]